VPSVDWNREEWDKRYTWDADGDEWSAPWGGAEAQWKTCLLPRVSRFLPARTVLEIAPGFGRWTQFLLGQCESYAGVDLAPKCVEACKQRYSEAKHAQFFVNDGLSLSMIADRSVDLAFSFDSLVHVEDDVIGSYLCELSAKLTEDGVAFIHHSNLGAYRAALARDPVFRPLSAVARHLSDLLPSTKRFLESKNPNKWQENRAHSMTAERFVELSQVAGLKCVAQEVINWNGPRLIDCISLVTKSGSVWDRAPVFAQNVHFFDAARSSALVAQVWLPRKMTTS
jgi:hypothetical protein